MNSEVVVAVRRRSMVGFDAFWLSLLTLNRYGNRLLTTKGYGAVEAARDLFRRFLQDGQESHVLLLDDDAVLGAETLTRLLERDLPVVGALTWASGLPTHPVLYRGWEGVYAEQHPRWQVRYDDVAKWLALPEVQMELLERQTEAGLVLKYNGPTALSRVDAIGFHCVLIRRDVLEQIGEPYCAGNENGVREDFDFSERSIRKGFDLFVDKTVIAGHIIAHAIRPLDYYIYEFARQNAQGANP